MAGIYDNLTKRQLEAYLREKEPQLVRIIASRSRAMYRDITYAQIRQALLDGNFDAKWLEDWRVRYSDYILRVLVPVWRDSMRQAAMDALRDEARRTRFTFDEYNRAISDWTERRSATLVTRVTDTQREAIRALVARVTVGNTMGVDELAKAIRPVVGLYEGQAVANINYYMMVKQRLMKEHPKADPGKIARQAQDAAIRYAEKQHRYRAQMIARTEVVTSYNAGRYYAVKQLIDQGIILGAKKTWVSARDARVCAKCRALDDVTVDFYEEFPGGVLYPTLHPHCRCVISYEYIMPDGGW